MTPSVQRCVDAMAERLGLPVSLTDPDLNSLVFSPHGDAVIDDVRRDSILLRQTAGWVREWFAGYGVGRSRVPVRVEPHPDRDAVARWVVPVRHRGTEYGLLCVLDPERRCDHASADLIADLVAELAELMHDQESHRLEQSRHVHDLLLGSASMRHRALAYLQQDSPIAADSLVVVITITGRPAPSTAPKSASVSGSAAARGAANAAGPGVQAGDSAGPRSGPVTRRLLQSAESDHHAFLVAAPDRTAALIAHLARLAAPCCGPLLAGVGEPRPLSEAGVSHRQARAAMTVGHASSVHAGSAAAVVTDFADLGALRFLAGRSGAELDAAIDPRTRQLLNSTDPDLQATVQRYLDTGGDTAATASALNIHRGTLYYRIRKAETLTGLNFADGHDRLTAQLSLLAHQLTSQDQAPHHAGPVRLLGV